MRGRLLASAAAVLAAAASVAFPAAQDAAQGAALAEERGCGNCHGAKGVAAQPGVPYGLDFGHYTVTNRVDYGVDLSAHYGIGYYAEGANAVYSYYDAFDGVFLPTLYGSQGIPGTYTGLGGEFDYAPDPVFGGYYLIG